jgi:hypothetical protein
MEVLVAIGVLYFAKILSASIKLYEYYKQNTNTKG